MVRAQVKYAPLPIVAYQDCTFWRATNLAGEPRPAAPRKSERFILSGVPAAERPHFAVASCDNSNNRSALSNVIPSNRD